MKKPVALQPEENAFIEKTLHYISEIRGAIKTNLTLSTNTKFPTRYILMVRGLPCMNMNDFLQIINMNEDIRSIVVSMADDAIYIDVWRTGKAQRAKKRRKRKREDVTVTARYDLSSVDRRDRKCLETLLYKLNAMDDLECQFNMRVDTSHPEYYQLELTIYDTIKLASLKNVLHECRTFCNDFEFDFPHNILRAKCLRLAAPLRRRVLTLKNRTR